MANNYAEYQGGSMNRIKKFVTDNSIQFFLSLFITLYLLVGIIISGLVIRTLVNRYYYDIAYQMDKQAEQYITLQVVSKYQKNMTIMGQDEEYGMILSNLRKLKKANSDMLYLYVISTLDREKAVFLFDTDESSNHCRLGDTDYYDDEIARQMENIDSGKDVKPAISNGDKYDRVMTVMLPVKDQNGKMVAFIASDISMKSVTDSSVRFFILSVFLYVAGGALFLAIVIQIMKKRIAVISSLSGSYLYAFRINLKRDRFSLIILNGTMMRGELPKEGRYSAFHEKYIEATHPDDLKKVQEMLSPEYFMENLTAERSSYQIEFRSKIKQDDADYVWSRIKVILLRNNVFGRPDEVITAVEDIDEQKRNDEAKRLMLMEALKRAKEADEAKSAFLSNMSHEIRTPMNAICGMAEALKSETLTEEQTDYVNIIRNSADSLLHIINDILDISKVESGKLEIVSETYKVSSMFDEINDMMRFAFRDKGLEYYFEPAENMPVYLIGDMVRVHQIIVNILNNAFKYTDKGSVRLETAWIPDEEQEGILKVVVEDTGIGIKAEDIDSIFDAFSQSDTGKNHHIEGTGLGLAICRILIDMMNGSINVTSEYGKGSRFTVMIPQTRSSEKHDESDADEHENAVTEKLLFENAKVLIVDDNAVNRKVAATLMMKMGIKAGAADSGERAIKIIEEGNKFDIIFMDHLMPDMDGIETVKRIRKLDIPYAKSAVIVALTANAVGNMKEQLLSAGMNDFISKPIDMSELHRVLKKYLSEKIVTK